MKKILTILTVICAITLTFQSYAQSTGTGIKFSKRILFIPLDSRPPCLDFTQKIGLIANAELVSPPEELLGVFTTPGQSEKINEWILSQELSQFDAAIIAIDMVAYGGLVASRVHDTDVNTAVERVKIIEELRKKAPKLRIYAQNVVMRLAPTPHGKNEAYRTQLQEWAHICVMNDEKSKQRTKQLESIIPADVLQEFKDARHRNLSINLQSLENVKKGNIDFLILSQDDAEVEGLHVADRERLIKDAKEAGVISKVTVQPGADEVSMLLLSRALSDLYKQKPTIAPVFSSNIMADKVMPFEDKPLRSTVSKHIHAAGAIEISNPAKADILFYVYTSRKETGRGVSFAAEIEAAIKKGRRVIVADIDPIGDVQGGDIAFTDAMIQQGVMQQLHGYASWNTAGNTIGTALPHGITFTIAEKQLLKKKQFASSVITAQNWFTINRILDDYYFHNIVREQANELADQRKRSATILSPEKRKMLEEFGTTEMQKHLDKLIPYYFEGSRPYWNKKATCGRPSDLTFTLPWNRTFEAHIDFKLRCTI